MLHCLPGLTCQPPAPWIGKVKGGIEEKREVWRRRDKQASAAGGEMEASGCMEADSCLRQMPQFASGMGQPCECGFL